MSLSPATRSHSLVRNLSINLAGLGVPVLVALVSVPVVIGGLGAERFGILTTVWALIGYFTLLDLGLANAVTKLVAERLGGGREREVPELAWTAIWMLLLCGVVGGGALGAFSSLLVARVFSVSVELQAEVRNAFLIVAATVPWVVMTGGLRGMLEAYHRFDLVSAVRLLMGLFTYLGPLMVLPFTNSLAVVVGVLGLGRFVVWVIHVVLALRQIPELRAVLAPRRPLARELLGFGGWISLTNGASTFLLYLDRFFIGATLSMVAVAYYATPYEAIIRLWIIPGALVEVVFPAFAATLANGREGAAQLFEKASRLSFLALFPFVLVVLAFAGELLDIWVGAEFAANGTRVFQWLAAGMLINGAGLVAAAGLQGLGRPDLPGKLNLLQVPLYVGALWWLLGAFGIVGAAVAWALRASIDALALSALADRMTRSGNVLVRRALLLILMAMVLLVLAMSLTSTGGRVGFALSAIAGYALIGWTRILTAAERDQVLGTWPRFRRHGLRSALAER